MIGSVWITNVLAQAAFVVVSWLRGRGRWFSIWLSLGVLQSIVLASAVGNVRTSGWSYIAVYTPSETLVLLAASRAALEVFRHRAAAYVSVGRVGTWCWWAGMGTTGAITAGFGVIADQTGWQLAPFLLLVFRRSVIWILLGYLTAALILFGHSRRAPSRIRIRHFTLLAWLSIHGISMLVNSLAGPQHIATSNVISLLATTVLYSAAAVALLRAKPQDFEITPVPDPDADYALMKADRLLEELAAWRPR
jgi:hypothetical protein